MHVAGCVRPPSCRLVQRTSAVEVTQLLLYVCQVVSRRSGIVLVTELVEDLHRLLAECLGAGKVAFEYRDYTEVHPYTCRGVGIANFLEDGKRLLEEEPA